MSAKLIQQAILLTVIAVNAGSASKADGQSAPMKAAPPPRAHSNTADAEQLARLMLADARQWAQRQRFSSARRLVERARALPVPWTDPANSPDAVLKEIDRLQYGFSKTELRDTVREIQLATKVEVAPQTVAKVEDSKAPDAPTAQAQQQPPVASATAPATREISTIHSVDLGHGDKSTESVPPSIHFHGPLGIAPSESEVSPRGAAPVLATPPQSDRDDTRFFAFAVAYSIIFSTVFFGLPALVGRIWKHLPGIRVEVIRRSASDRTTVEDRDPSAAVDAERETSLESVKSPSVASRSAKPVPSGIRLSNVDSGDSKSTFKDQVVRDNVRLRQLLGHGSLVT